eukprot:CAMPEP_0194029066 /NCGR_PEP_ID=MMETSP0009_2-20130614/2912_1 /TAXON_ID=210454 /ORGANISM="Grammatophora oceanica, Strain CCMP 410" /LENGTH=533 /DNA_ID=CAMNT_0038668653 /DNA_START=54 /DNA_END=1655 /DNA_ORIENTATION=+
MSTPSGYGAIPRGNTEAPLKDQDSSPVVTRRSKPRTIFLVAALPLVLVAVIAMIVKHKRKVHHWDDKTTYYETRLFEDQLVNHFSNADSDSEGRFAQKYYEFGDHFGGPGHPLFVIIGGEGVADGLLYSFIYDYLGEHFGAHSIRIEHRFYGSSQPVLNPSDDDLKELLHPRQALFDVARLVLAKQHELGCGEKGTPTYCPVMTVGGSYPGFLSALMKIVHPDVVDIGYASSAPLHLYSHTSGPFSYFDKVTQVADDSSPGCANDVKETLVDVQQAILASDLDAVDLPEVAASLGICEHSMPKYISSKELLAQELTMLAPLQFADFNMGFYPPNDDSELMQACRIFQNSSTSSKEKFRAFVQMGAEGNDGCFDLNSVIPPGKYGAVSASDWSGVGDGPDGFSWDFQSCTLIQECGMSNESMFIPRTWTIEWLTDYCQKRWSYTPHEQALVEEFGFEDLSNVTHILFTNGLNDGWSAQSHLNNVSDTVTAVNFANGAHHSEMYGPRDEDTADIRNGQAFIKNLLVDWLDQVKED